MVGLGLVNGGSDGPDVKNGNGGEVSRGVKNRNLVVRRKGAVVNRKGMVSVS